MSLDGPSRDLAFDRVLELDDVLDRALDRVRAFDRDLARVRAFDLDLDTDPARDRDLELAYELANDCARNGVFELDPELLAALDRVRGQVRVLGARLGAGVSAHGTPVVPVPVRVVVCAGWLVEVALRVVPVGERSRYGEEWRGELWDLAAGSGRRRRQTGHAVRLVVRAWPVRSGIRQGRRRAAGGG